MNADNPSQPGGLDLTILGLGGAAAPGAQVGADQPAGGADFGLGDLAFDNQPRQQPARRPVDQPEWGAFLRAITADLTPAIGLRFRAWAKQHAELLVDKPAAVQLALYLEIATYRDALADEQRPETEREYDWAELHMDGLRPLIEAEVQAQREAIADGVRQAYISRLKALQEQGLIGDDVLQMMMAGVSDG